MIVRCLASALNIRSLPEVAAGTETGRKLVKGQRATVHGESLDGKWFYVDAPAGRGWASGQYLAEVQVPVAAEEPVASPAWPRVPKGYDDIVRVFGEPGSAMCSAGRVILPAPLKLSYADVSVKTFACHKLLEDVLTSVFNQIHERGLWDAINDGGFGGCYNVRKVTKSQKISTHAWGIAPDLDVSQNQLGDKTPEQDPRVVAIFEDHGFEWGGRWTRPDGMHFQYCRGY